MNNGYWQKLLRVDLASGKTRTEPIDQRELEQLIGGQEGLSEEVED